VVAFQVTFAREFTEDQLALGLGLQLLRADLFYKNLIFRDNPMDAPLDDRPYDKIPEFSKNDGTGWGFGLNLGMQWKLNEKTTAAATLQIPFSITVSGTTEFTFVMPKGSPYLPYDPGTEEYLFTSGEAVTPEAEFEADLKLPMSFAIGFAHELSETVTLALDAEYTAWSTFEGFDFAYSSFADLPEGPGPVYLAEDFFVQDLTSPSDWDNTIKVMLGASWDATEALTLLGGVFMDQSPLSSSDLVTPHFVDPGDKLGINAGLLFTAHRWELGLASSYIHTSDDQDVTSLIDVDGDGIHDNFAAHYSARTYETTLSVNYRF
jgi:long-chain fatty acid transport protein